MKLITRTTQVVILPKGEALFSEQATRISIESEGEGEFIEISQDTDSLASGSVRFDVDEWETINIQVVKMIADINQNKQELVTTFGLG